MEVAIDEFYVSPTGRPENGPIYLVKGDNITSEQTFLFIIEFQLLPNSIIGEDLIIGESGQASGDSVVIVRFDVSQQRVPFRFTLLPDTIPEGLEVFLPSIRLPDGMVETFPTTFILNPSTTINILDDNDSKFCTHQIDFYHFLLHF